MKPKALPSHEEVVSYYHGGIFPLRASFLRAISYASWQIQACSLGPPLQPSETGRGWGDRGASFHLAVSTFCEVLQAGCLSEPEGRSEHDHVTRPRLPDPMKEYRYKGKRNGKPGDTDSNI